MTLNPIRGGKMMPEKKRGPMKLSEIGQKTSKARESTDKSRQPRPSKKRTSPEPVYDKQNEFDEVSSAANDLLEKAKSLQSKKKTPAINENHGSTGEASEPAEDIAGAISLIEVQKKNKKRFNVYINGQFALGIGENTLIKFALHKGQVLEADVVKEIQQIDKEDYAYQVAVRFLSHQLRSEQEVRKKLVDEEIEDAIIDQAIKKLKEVKLIDDNMYGQAYTRTAMNINKKGPSVIARELKRKGLDENEIEQSLAEYDEDVLQENAYTLAEKYFQKQLRKESHRNAIQKTKQHLMQRGYDSSLIQELMTQLAEVYQDEDQELEVLNKDIEKYMRKYRKLKGKDLIFKVKGMLYNKGYQSELINQALMDYEDNL